VTVGVVTGTAMGWVAGVDCTGWLSAELDCEFVGVEFEPRAVVGRGTVFR
jgi:hypothetical protein